MKNHGQFAALVVASALLVDYVLTVAVSVSAGTDNIISAFPGLNEYRVEIALGLVALLAALNLRGVRESGRAFAAPTYLFITALAVMIGTGLVRYFFSPGGVVAESAGYDDHTGAGVRRARRPGAGLLRAAGLRVRVHRADRGRGDRQRRAGLPAAEEPQRGHHPGLMGGIAVAAVRRGHRPGAAVRGQVRRVPLRPGRLHRLRDRAPAHRDRADRGGDLRRRPVGRLLLQSRRSPRWCSSSPRTPPSTVSRCWARCSRRTGSCRASCTPAATSSCTATASCCSPVSRGCSSWSSTPTVSRLIQLYILGVFTSFSIGQWGMVRHWNRELRTTHEPQDRRRIRRSQVDQRRRRHPHHRSCWRSS